MKDRPVVVVLAVAQVGDRRELVVAPITHSTPDAASGAVPVPPQVKRDLGLDRERSWIVASEVNRFRWPGPDIRLLQDGSPFHGAIPDWLLAQLRQAIGAFAKRGKVKLTNRTE